MGDFYKTYDELWVTQKLININSSGKTAMNFLPIKLLMEGAFPSVEKDFLNELAVKYPERMKKKYTAKRPLGKSVHISV